MNVEISTSTHPIKISDCSTVVLVSMAIAEAYLGLYQVSMMKYFVKTLNALKPLPNFVKTLSRRYLIWTLMNICITRQHKKNLFLEKIYLKRIQLILL